MQQTLSKEAVMGVFYPQIGTPHLLLGAKRISDYRVLITSMQRSCIRNKRQRTIENEAWERA